MSASIKLPEHGALRVAYQAAAAMAVVTAVCCAIVVVLLVASAVQMKLSDPLNTPALVELRERFAADTANTALKQDIRALDLMARKAYFTSLSQVRRGGIILLAGAVLLGVLVTVIDGLRVRLPDPSGCPGLDSVWAQVLEKRRALAAVAVALVAGGIVAALVSSSVLTRWGRGTVRRAPVDAPRPGVTHAPVAD